MSSDCPSFSKSWVRNTFRLGNSPSCDNPPIVIRLNAKSSSSSDFSDVNRPKPLSLRGELEICSFFQMDVFSDVFHGLIGYCQSGYTKVFELFQFIQFGQAFRAIMSLIFCLVVIVRQEHVQKFEVREFAHGRQGLVRQAWSRQFKMLKSLNFSQRRNSLGCYLCISNVKFSEVSGNLPGEPCPDRKSWNREIA